MGLILTRILYSVDASLENASRIFIWVPRRALSLPYELPMYSILKGEILNVDTAEAVISGDLKKILEELRAKPIEFILFKRKTGSQDALFLSSDTWPTLRDYGVLPEQYEIEVRICEARFDDKTVDIYPKRDVHVD